MNQNRTFGVELETHSSLSRYELAEKLTTELRAVGHVAYEQGWGHNTDSSNRNVWYVKSDGSINGGSQARVPNGYGVDAEVVSPVLKGQAGLDALAIVCRVLTQYCKVTANCGLHVHHGVDSRELVGAINAWLACESVLIDCLPMSRRNNGYCKTLANRAPRIGDNESLSHWQTRARVRGDRYVTFNLESFALRSTIEVRCGAGTTEFAKVANWVVITQRLIEQGQVNRAPANNFGTIDETIDYFKLPLTGQAGQAVQGTGELRKHPKGAGYGNHKAGTMAHRLDALMTTGNTVSAMIAILETEFAVTYAIARQKVMGHVNYLKYQGMVFTEVGRGDERFVKCSLPSAGTAPVQAETVPEIVQNACNWLKNRYCHFNPAQACVA